MPAPSDKAVATFGELKTSLQGKVPPALLAQFEQTFGEFEKVPEIVDYLGTFGMFRRDAERVYSEARALRTEAENKQLEVAEYERNLQAYENHLRENAHNFSAGELAEARSQVETYRQEGLAAKTRLQVLEDKLKESNIFELFSEDLPAISDPGTGAVTPPVVPETVTTGTTGTATTTTTTTTGETTNMPANTQPTNPMDFATPTQVKAMVEQAAMDAFRGGLTGALAVNQYASELSQLTGKPVNPVQLSSDWLNSQKPIEQYIEENFNLKQLRDAAANTQRETEINAEVQRRLQEEMSKARIGAATGNSGSTFGTPRSPVFQGFQAKTPLNTQAPAQVQTQPQTPGVPANPAIPATPANGGSTLQPTDGNVAVHNISNRPNGQGGESTAVRVARLMAEGTYAGGEGKFDLSSNLFRG